MTGILFRIAMRNLRLHWVRTLIVGLLLFAGTFVIVLGSGLRDAVQDGMQRSIIDSLAGHVQIISEDAEDDLELWRSIAFGVPELGKLEPFGDVKSAIEGLDEVEAVIPMGVNRSFVIGKATLDVKLGELREAVRNKELEKVPALRAHVRQICQGLGEDLDKLTAIVVDDDDSERQRKAVATANSDAFWEGFDEDPLAALEFLDNQVAPLGAGSGFYFLMYIGTDMEAFAKQFDLFEVVDGQMPPPGQRGFMFNVHNYEKFIKHKAARRFDKIKEARELEGRLIATDEDLKRGVERLVGQHRIITDELNPDQAAEVIAELKKTLGSDETDIVKLLGEFFTLTDDNFDSRYKSFYEIIAPRIRLHRFVPGDTMTMYSQDASRAVNVRIWGTFRFKGLEKATMAGNHHLMDLMTFREIYGLDHGASEEEIARLKERSEVEVVDRDAVEDELFGDTADADGTADADDGAEGFDEFAGTDIKGRLAEAEARRAAGFTQADLEGGAAINAAIFLKDPKTIDEAIPKIEAAAKNAGFGVKAVDWQSASGIVGQMSGLMDGGLVVIIIIIFTVAILIISLALVMSTMDRRQEIGTMRAIGAKRQFVVRLIVLEAAALAFIAGALGALCGALLLISLGESGIPATSDIQFFLFGGASLKPVLVPQHLINAFIAVLIVSILAPLIPAIMASRVSPAIAMSGAE